MLCLSDVPVWEKDNIHIPSFFFLSSLSHGPLLSISPTHKTPTKTFSLRVQCPGLHSVHLLASLASSEISV
jgi:hypothetical protein